MNAIPSRKWKYRENDTQSDLALGRLPTQLPALLPNWGLKRPWGE
jgi:hypothetical protein